MLQTTTRTIVVEQPRKTLSSQARRFVAEVRWRAESIALVESRAKGAQSPTAHVIEVLTTGITGNGCRGTKGVGRPPEHDPEPSTLPDAIRQRYARLSPEARRIADLCASDPGMDVVTTVTYGKRETKLSFEARLGFALADKKQRERWEKKCSQGDARPAIAGAEFEGSRTVEATAEEYFLGPT